MSEKFEIKLMPTRCIESIACDRCKREFEWDDTNDRMQIQEMLRYEDIGGYDSIFGDGYYIRLDLCQQCIQEVLGEWLRVTEK